MSCYRSMQHAAFSIQRCGFARLHLCTLASLHNEGAITLHVDRLAEPGVDGRGSYTTICPPSIEIISTPRNTKNTQRSTGMPHPHQPRDPAAQTSHVQLKLIHASREQRGMAWAPWECPSRPACQSWPCTSALFPLHRQKRKLTMHGSGAKT